MISSPSNDDHSAARLSENPDNPLLKLPATFLATERRTEQMAVRWLRAALQVNLAPTTLADRHVESAELRTVSTAG